MAEKSEKDKKTVDFIVKEFQRYESHWSSRFTKAEAQYQDWMNTPPARSETWMNAVHVPVTVEAEQTISPRLFTALFPNDAPLDVKVEGDEDPLQCSGSFC